MSKEEEVLHKADLASAMANAMGVTKKHASEVIDVLFDHISQSTTAGKKVRIHGFGTFQVKHKEARIARNPLTGAEVNVAAKDVLVFKASKTAA